MEWFATVNCFNDIEDDAYIFGLNLDVSSM